MTVANIITLLRIVMVPLIVWLMLTDQLMLAFIVFVLAGLSDAVDGALARHLNQQTDFGTALDPVADKIMLATIFVLLAWLGEIPLWLAILVFSRDVLIIAGVIFAMVIGRPIAIKPLFVSKANTFAQIVLAALVLGELAFEWPMPAVRAFMIVTTAALTAASAAAYIGQGMRAFSNGGEDTTEDNAAVHTR